MTLTAKTSNGHVVTLALTAEDHAKYSAMTGTDLEKIKAYAKDKLGGEQVVDELVKSFDDVLKASSGSGHSVSALVYREGKAYKQEIGDPGLKELTENDFGGNKEKFFKFKETVQKMRVACSVCLPTPQTSSSSTSPSPAAAAPAAAPAATGASAAPAAAPAAGVPDSKTTKLPNSVNTSQHTSPDQSVNAKNDASTASKGITLSISASNQNVQSKDLKAEVDRIQADANDGKEFILVSDGFETKNITPPEGYKKREEDRIDYTKTNMPLKKVILFVRNDKIDEYDENMANMKKNMILTAPDASTSTAAAAATAASAAAAATPAADDTAAPAAPTPASSAPKAAGPPPPPPPPSPRPHHAPAASHSPSAPATSATPAADPAGAAAAAKQREPSELSDDLTITLEAVPTGTPGAPAAVIPGEPINIANDPRFVKSSGGEIRVVDSGTFGTNEEIPPPTEEDVPPLPPTDDDDVFVMPPPPEDITDEGAGVGGQPGVRERSDSTSSRIVESWNR